MIKIWGNALTFGFRQLCKAQEEKNVASFLDGFDIACVGVTLRHLRIL